MRRQASPEGAAEYVTPFQGWRPFAVETQGVALGWHVCGPLALRAPALSAMDALPLFALPRDGGKKKQPPALCGGAAAVKVDGNS